MPLQTINNGDSGAVARAKINAAIDAINAMSTTTTTTTQPTTTSSTTSTSSTTTTQPTTTSSTTTSSTTTSSTTTSSTTAQTIYRVSKCTDPLMIYYITTTTPVTIGWAYKFMYPASPFDGTTCWQVDAVSSQPVNYTYVSPGGGFSTCVMCNNDTTTTSTSSTTTSSTTYVPPPTTTSTTTMP